MFGRKTREQQRRQVIDLATRAWGQQVFVAQVRSPEIVWRVEGLDGRGTDPAEQQELAKKPRPLATSGKIVLWVVFGVFILAFVVIIAVLLDDGPGGGGGGGSSSGGGGSGGGNGCLDLPDAPKRHRITVYGEHEECAAVPFGRSFTEGGRQPRQANFWMVWSDTRIGVAHIDSGETSFIWEESSPHPQLTKRRPRLTWSWPDGSSARVRFTRAERRRARKQAR